MIPKFTVPRNKFTVDLSSKTVTAEGDSLGKISGTMMGAVLGVSPWASPFTVACELLGLGTEDISSKPAIMTGHVLESRIIEYANEAYKDMGTFVPADVIYGNREGEHEDWTPDFDNDDFTGHVDGLLMTADGEDYILEVKTSSNSDAWLDGVPEYYFWQVALYDRFITEKGKAYLIKGAVNRDTYADPESWTPNETNTTMYSVDLDKARIDEGIRKVKEWREELGRTRTTPPADLSRKADAALFNHLCDLGVCDRSFEDLIDEYGNVKSQLKEVEEEYQWLTDKEERLKGILRSHMEMNGMTDAESRSGRYTVSMTKSKRKALDADLLRSAGIDPDPYFKETAYTTLRIKEPKVKDIWQ